MSTESLEAQALIYVLSLSRITVFMAMLPMFGGRSLPRLIKIGLAVALAATWLPSAGLDTASSLALVQNTPWPLYLGLAAREMLVGAIFGYACGLVLLPTQLAGAYVGQEMGFTLGAIANPTSGDSGNVMSALFDSLGFLMFLALDLHLLLFATLYATFFKFPVGVWGIPGAIAGLPDALSRAHSWGVVIAAPIAICLFLNLIVLAILAKVAPQLNLFSVGLTIRIVVGILATLAFLPELMHGVTMVHIHAFGPPPAWAR